MSLPIKCLEFVAILVVSADTGLLEGILPYVRAEWGKWPIFEGTTRPNRRKCDLTLDLVLRCWGLAWAVLQRT